MESGYSKLKRLFSAEYDSSELSLPASGKLNRKSLILSLISFVLLYIPGLIAIVQTVRAYKAKNLAQEKKLLFSAKIWSVLGIILGAAYVFFQSLV